MKSQRGSTLLLVMIIIVVLTIVGIAALRMSQEEAVSVSQRIHSQQLRACAAAASNKLWAEYALAGTGTRNVTSTQFEGGTFWMSLSHYDQDWNWDSSSKKYTTMKTVTFDNDTFRPVQAQAVTAGMQNMDDSNTFRMGGLGGQPYSLIAHCTDDKQNQYEVELLVKFGI